MIQICRDKKIVFGGLMLLGWVVPLSAQDNECLSRVEGERSFIVRAESCEIPQDLEVNQGGYPEAPVVSCPRPSKYYADLLDRLNGLKLNIKNEACRDTKAVIEKDLASLISTDREQFVSLVKKGYFSKGQLTKDEVTKVTNYVGAVVNKAKGIAEALNFSVDNEACFPDDDKQATLGFIGSAVSEVSGAIGAVAGPFGAKVAIGGEIAGQLLVSLNTILEDRRPYDFSKADDLKNYFNSLCTYYDFKSELDGEANFLAKPSRLKELLQIIEGDDSTPGFLDIAKEKCSVCATLIEDLAEDYHLPDENGGKASDDESSDWDYYEQLAGDTNFADKTIADLLRSYEDEYGDLWRLNPMPPVQLDPNEFLIGVYLQELGIGVSHLYVEPPKVVVPLYSAQKATIRAMQIRSWAHNKLNQLGEDRREKLGEDLRYHVNRAQKQLEKVLVKEASIYINSIRTRLKRDLRRLRHEAQLAEALFPEKNFEGIRLEEFQLGNSIADHEAIKVAQYFDLLWRPDINLVKLLEENNSWGRLGPRWFTKNVLYKGYDPQQVGASLIFFSWQDDKYDVIIDRLRENLERRLANLIDSHSLVVKKCEFFENSHFTKHGPYKNRILRSCRRSKNHLARSQRIIGAISGLTSYGKAKQYEKSPLNSIFEPRKNFVADWLDSVTFSIRRDFEAMTK